MSGRWPRMRDQSTVDDLADDLVGQVEQVGVRRSALAGQTHCYLLGVNAKR